MRKVSLLPDDENVWRELWLAGLLVEEATGKDPDRAPERHPLPPHLLKENPSFLWGERAEKLRHTHDYWRMGLLLEE